MCGGNARCWKQRIELHTCCYVYGIYTHREYEKKITLMRNDVLQSLYLSLYPHTAVCVCVFIDILSVCSKKREHKILLHFIYILHRGCTLVIAVCILLWKRVLRFKFVCVAYDMNEYMVYAQETKEIHSVR